MSQHLLSEPEKTMAEFQVTLTAEERAYLLDLLKRAVKEMLIEEHRTRTPTYREHVIHQEVIAQGLLNKILQVPA